MKLLYFKISILFLLPLNVLAMSSASYSIDADVISIGGDTGTSANYKLSDTIGEPVISQMDSASYSGKFGFWQMTSQSLVLTLDSDTKNLGNLTPGTPVTGQTVATVTTDAWNGYSLAAKQNHDMLHTDTTSTIPAYSCSIASPCAWSGAGLGFTVADGTSVEAKWGTNPNYNYAAFTDTSTTIHQKENYYSSGDDTTIEYKVDVPSTQKAGAYSNIITYTATASL